MKILVAVAFIMAGFFGPACCCGGARSVDAATAAPSSGCCGAPAPAEDPSCPAGGGCALEDCVQAPAAAVLAHGVSAAPAAAPERTVGHSLDLPPPTLSALSRPPACARAEAVPKRHVYCVYRI